MTPKRGLTHAEAMAYVGVRRRTFHEAWRPSLVGMRQGLAIYHAAVETGKAMP